MKIYFITEEKYPDISASANRLKMITKGIDYSGVDYQVLVIGWFKKMPFKIHFILSIFYKLFSSITLMIKVRKEDIAFFYGPFVMPWIPWLLKLKGVSMYTERTEFPHSLILENPNAIHRIKSRLALKSMGFCKGLITCSDTLAKFYAEKTKIKKFLVIPLIIDKETYGGFENLYKKEITYCGYMGNNKDGIYNLLNAFSQVYKVFPEWKLKLIGSAEESVFEALKNEVRSKNLEKVVLFTGKIPHKEVLKLINQSSILALARPNNKQAQGGFPSKLGEYLSTGLPVVVTKVGEIPNYIKNNVNGFLVEPDDIDAFANKLIHVIKDYSNSRAIGMEGKKVSESFDYKIQGLQIVDFIKN